MTAAIFPGAAFQDLRRGLLARSDVETCAIGFTRDAGERLLVPNFELAPEDAYAERTRLSAVLRPEYLADVVQRAARSGLGCLFAHSHPGDNEVPSFSAHDDHGERRIARFLEQKNLVGRHAALVTSPGGTAARLLGSGESIDVVEVGLTLQLTSTAETLDTPDLSRFDRQIRAFGSEGQRRIADLHVAVVGSGGTGTLTIQQLGLLGVRQFTLIDFDQVEMTNLNRLAGAGAGDVGHPKLDVARRMLFQIDPSMDVRLISGDVVDDDVARGLIGCDFIFLCTDSHASRAVVNQLAYQYLVPTIDQGVSLSVRGGRLSFITGRVQLLAPGLPCLTCMELLDSEQIRRDMLTPEARAADPYIVGFHEPQPSVVSLNATMASLAVSMFIGTVTSAPIDARLQLYDGIAGTVRPVTARRDEACIVCSTSGALARADAWPLPTRRA
jgi:molybdopterin-synthase adenylyltransferase